MVTKLYTLIIEIRDEQKFEDIIRKMIEAVMSKTVTITIGPH